MLVNHDKQVFAAKRIDMTTEAWQMPQGGVDPGETPVEAACRELHEEVGTTRALLVRESRDWLPYDVPAELQPASWKGRWRGQAQKWFALAFTGSAADIDIAHDGDHAEFTAWQWMAARDLVQQIVPFKRAVYQAALKEFADLV